MTTDRVARVWRERNMWVGEIAGDSTFARTLSQLRKHLREVIVLRESLPDDADPDFSIYLDDEVLGPAVGTASDLRRAASEADRDAAVATTAAVLALQTHAVTDRDAAVLLGVSFQRIHQLRSRH